MVGIPKKDRDVMRNALILAITLTIVAVFGNAAVNGTVRGLIHDPQHRPVANAEVVLHAARSDWKLIPRFLAWATSSVRGYREFSLPEGSSPGW